MSLRPIGLPPPPHSEDPGLARYLQQIRSAIAGLPFSFFSTADGPNVSGITAPRGTIGIEIGSSATTKMWFKTDDSSATTGWSTVTFI